VQRSARVIFPVLLHAGYSSVRVVGWCGEWSCAGTVHMGVRGVGSGGQVCAQCAGHGVRGWLRAAPRMRGFLMHVRAGYSGVCAAGWCGKWSCAGAVHMAVRGGGGGGMCRVVVWAR
jgi:hypothetical protein